MTSAGESIREAAAGCLVYALAGSVPSVLLFVGIGAWMFGVRWLATLCFYLLGFVICGTIVWAVWRGVTAPREAARHWSSYSRREKAVVVTLVGVTSVFVLGLVATLIALYFA